MKSSRHDVPRFWRSCWILIGFWLIVIIIAAIVWRVRAQPGTAVYIQHVIYRPNIGVAWLAGTQEDAAKLGAYHHYACCSACPEPGGAKIPILRPGTFWADCPPDYAGYLLVGNEGEFRGQDDMSPAQMAQFIEDARAEHPQATFICLNSYLIDYMLDVIALLSPDTCQVYGLHIYGSVDVSEHLDGLCQSCRIWITEIGQCGGDGEELYRMVQEARADSRVGMILFYTAVGGIETCLDGIGQDGELTTIGQAFYNAVTEAYP